jgi:hypothetical protein
MNDTRLWDLLSDVESAMRTVREITDGPLPTDRAERARVIEERHPFYQAADGMRGVHRVILKALRDELCGRVGSVGSECTRQAEHSDAHRSVWGHTWTDEADRRSAMAIAQSMEGRRD